MPMAHTRLEEAAGLTVADVVHRRFSALPADATIGEVREWFAISTSRRMAFLADDGRYVGSLSRDRDGRLLGVVSVTEDLQAFCGTGDAPGDC